MGQASTILAGAACGLVGSIAPSFLYERALKPGTRVSVGMGLASIFVSFMFMTLALLAAYLAAKDEVLAFGCAMVATFLLFWAVEAVRGWRAANGGAEGPR